MPRFDVNSYVDVAERIQLFWEKYPDGAIITEFLSDPNNLKTILVQAQVFKINPGIAPDHAYPDATGLAFEEAGGSGANLTSHVENGETSAIGRALANLGLKTRADEPRPSKQEMQKVERLSPPAAAGTAGTGLARIFRSES